MNVTKEEVSAGAKELGLAGVPLCVHSSLRSFPHLVDGPATLVEGLLSTGSTVMVPTMANLSFGIPAPPDDRPARNAIDYPEKDRLAAANPWPGMSDIYDPTRTEVDADLGATAAYVAARPDRIRCRRSPGTFSAVGPLAAELIGREAPDEYGPLRDLPARGGWVLLAGVGLTRMTLLHLAEIAAGRRPFVHWTRGPDGRPQRSLGGECSEGFEALAPVLRVVERRTIVGQSLWRAYPANEAVLRAAKAIRSDPEITHCGDPGCIECADAIAGGPLDSQY